MRRPLPPGTSGPRVSFIPAHSASPRFLTRLSLKRGPPYLSAQKPAHSPRGLAAPTFFPSPLLNVNRYHSSPSGPGKFCPGSAGTFPPTPPEGWGQGKALSLSQSPDCPTSCLRSFVSSLPLLPSVPLGQEGHKAKASRCPFNALGPRNKHLESVCRSEKGLASTTRMQ